MEIVTGHRGTPHVTPYKVRDFNIGIVGAEDYVMNGGSELEAQLVSNNRIDIKDGSICMQGTHAVIPKNINDELTIENGMQGEKRIDLIVARYEKVADSGVESVNTVVLQGTPSKETPNVPGHVVGDIRNGDLKHEMPLYEVELDGINVVEVRPVFKKLVSAAEQQKMIESLNGKSIIEIGTSGLNHYIKYVNGLLVQWGLVSIGYTDGYGTISYPVPFSGTIKDYVLITQASYSGGGASTIVTSQKIAMDKGYAYARLVDGNKVNTHDADWFAIGRWK